MKKAFPWGKVLSVSEADEGNNRGLCRGKQVACYYNPHQSEIRDFCQLPPGEA